MHHKIITSLLLLGSLGLGTSILDDTSAQAARWHKGAPKIARGTWTDKPAVKGGEYDVLQISKKKLVFDDNTPNMTHLKYKKMGKRRYKFRGYNGETRRHQSMSTMYFVSVHHVTFNDSGNHLSLYKK
ncbi:hypothetical protein [Levilactobacillus yonginensis]|uniref:hypothetical protein n=1 Tax=Levilactobacillus yonginensis TaxID=1054041 RepID=UPI000F78B0DF|nr:hypothetical protein [Levilactobacillus yonginensis]